MGRDRRPPDAARELGKKPGAVDSTTKYTKGAKPGGLAHGTPGSLGTEPMNRDLSRSWRPLSLLAAMRRVGRQKARNAQARILLAG